MNSSEKSPLLGGADSSLDTTSGSITTSSGVNTNNTHSSRGHGAFESNSNSDDSSASNTTTTFSWLTRVVRLWQGLPFTKRMGIFSCIIFALVLLFHVLLMISELEALQQVDDDAVIPKNLQLLSELASNLVSEKKASVQFLVGQFTLSKYTAMTAAMDATDATVYRIVQGNLKDFLTKNGNGDYLSVHEATGMNRIRDIRRGLHTKAISSTAIDPRMGPLLGYSDSSYKLPPLQRVREIYNTALSKTVDVLTTQSTYYCRDLSIGVHFQTVGLLLSAQHLLIAGVSGRWVLQYGGAGASQFLTNWYSTSVITESFYSKFRYPKDDGGDLRIAAARSQGVLTELEAALSSNVEALPVNLTSQSTNTLEPLRNFLGGLADENGNESSDFTRDTIMVAIILAVLLYTVVTWAHFEWFAFAKVRRVIFTSSIMHDVHVRINEFVHAFGTFSLDLPPPPRTMQGTHVGVLELRLQQCLASLKALAPTLPPLLFPAQVHALASQISSIRDPSSLSHRRVRDSLGEIPVELIPTDSNVENNRFVTDMAKLTACGSTVVHVVCLTVDVSCFNEVGSSATTTSSMEGSMMNNKRIATSNSTWIEDAYQKVVSCVESTVCQYGGIMHFVGMGSCMAVWCGPEAGGPLDCAPVVSCGALLGRRLHILRKSHPQLLKLFKPYIGLTAGKAVRSIFGTSQSMKALQLFGAPLVFGHIVATVNQHHQTTLCCDQNVCDSIKGSRPCKPIEIIREGLLVDSEADRRSSERSDHTGRGIFQRGGDRGYDRSGLSTRKSMSFGRVYEVLVAPGGRGSGLPVDIEARLTMYCKGFDLYERGFYREASRAFRAYTKQYGYDSSVERIQSAISVL